MQFQKIRFDGKTVELDYTESTRSESQLVVEEKGEDPSPLFKQCLQAFASYVGWVISAPAAWEESIQVRGVTIKRPDDSPRGIVVTAVRTCPRARNGTMLINTPYLAQAPDGYTGDGTGFLPSHVPQLIDELEAEAEAYHFGSRGALRLDLEDSENADNFDERAAAAEVASTRKPGRKKKDPNTGKPAIHHVQNPDSTEPPLDDPQLRNLLLTVDRDVPEDAIQTWIRSDRLAAEGWARAKQRELTKSLHVGEVVPDEPACIVKSATLPLTAEQWTSDVAPPKAADVEPVRV